MMDFAAYLNDLKRALYKYSHDLVVNNCDEPDEYIEGLPLFGQRDARILMAGMRALKTGLRLDVDDRIAQVNSMVDELYCNIPSIKDTKEFLIDAALYSKGSKEGAARLLGVNKATMYRHLKNGQQTH